MNAIHGFEAEPAGAMLMIAEWVPSDRLWATQAWAGRFDLMKVDWNRRGIGESW